jgi:hypothetical protein
MILRLACVVLVLAAASCQRQESGAGGSAKLESPAPVGEPSRVFAPANAAARSGAGEMTVLMSLHLPDQTGGDAQEMLTLRAAKGLVVEAELTGAVSPATEVQGQTLRTLLALPVNEPQTLVYRVRGETHPEGVMGLCGGDEAAYVVVWEPATPGESALKIMGVSGAAPGAEAARPCTMLEFSRE